MIKRRSTSLAIVTALALVLAACASSSETGSTPAPTAISALTTPDSVPPPPELDAARIAAGEATYRQYCSACHGADLSGDPQWKTRNTDGSLRPPPHDSSGHTWHHSDQLLLSLTRDASGLEESRMPAFGAILTDDEIATVLEFFKSTWGPEERAFQWQVTWTEQQRAES